MAPFAIRLTETTGGWARAIGPVAEWVARQLWSTTHKRTQSNLPPTRLTQTRGRQAKGIGSAPIRRASPRLEKLCQGCGKIIRDGREHCANLSITFANQCLLNDARAWRVVGHKV